MDSKKQNVSVRLSTSDLRRIKEIAQRMHVRESDVFRFAVKTVLATLMPLNDPHVKGKDLLPMFADCYRDLTRHFEFDASRLERIINSGVDDPDQIVDRDDIELLVMAAVQENYALMRLNKLLESEDDRRDLGSALKAYLLDKYVGKRTDPRLDTALEPA